MANVRHRPRISVNKLAEYLTITSPSRRRTILRSQKFPRDVVVARYYQLLDPIQSFLEDGGFDVDPILRKIESLRESSPPSDWARDDNQCTADALECFLEVADSLPDGVEYRRSDDAPFLKIAGVGISVRPDLLMDFERKGQKCVGAVKFHHIKDGNKALKKPGQEYVATLCHKWLAENVKDRRAVHKNCLSVDLFRTTVVPAPVAFTQRMKDVEAACLDIAVLWPSLS